MRQSAINLKDKLIETRRTLHRRPELSGEERDTAAFIEASLRDLNLTPHTNVAGTNGLWADIVVDQARPAVALRADMDALPIEERADVDYRSENVGVMHACGHDAHMAMLLGAARLLLQHRDRLKRTVRLLFQPHEERMPGGAPAMIAGGALENVDRIFGLHVMPHLPTGTLGTRPGPFMAAVNELNITVRGRGGHAATPELCVDPIYIASQIVVALQGIVSRTVSPIEPAVVSVTQVHGGTAHNVIPDRVCLNGTIRTFSAQVRRDVVARVERVAREVAAAYNAEADVDIVEGYPVLENDPDLVREAWRAADTVGFKAEQQLELPPHGGGEDFAYYGKRVPAVFVFLGAGNAEKSCTYGNHHPRFNIDEDALPLGAALHAQFAMQAGGPT